MNREYILGDDNEPILATEPMQAWKWLEEHPHRKIVGLTRFPDGTRVSTVFLRLDHRCNGGPPVLWETMVFDGPPDGEYEDFQERYTSYKDAVQGHIAVVSELCSLSDVTKKGGK